MNIFPKLAWGDRFPEWTDHLLNEIKKQKWNMDIKNPCPKLPLHVSIAQCLSIMSKFESNFKPGTTYKESFKDSRGENVISRGLLQISFESANQKAYGCNLKSPFDLHDPLVNLYCGVKIANYWLNKDLFFFGDKVDPIKNKNIYLGFGRYWSVGRSKSDSNAKIKAYLAGLN